MYSTLIQKPEETLLVTDGKTQKLIIEGGEVKNDLTPQQLSFVKCYI